MDVLSIFNVFVSSLANLLANQVLREMNGLETDTENLTPADPGSNLAFMESTQNKLIAQSASEPTTAGIWRCAGDLTDI